MGRLTQVQTQLSLTAYTRNLVRICKNVDETSEGPLMESAKG